MTLSQICPVCAGTGRVFIRVAGISDPILYLCGRCAGTGTMATPSQPKGEKE